MKYLLSLLLPILLINICLAQPAIYTARGITLKGPDRAQENTLDAILAIKKWNKEHPNDQLAGAEVNLIVTKPTSEPSEPAFVCSHDEIIDELTDKKINIRTLSKAEIKKLQIKPVLAGIDYGKPRPFAFLDEVLDATMQGVPPFTIWLGVKDGSYRPTDGASFTAIQLAKALDEWHQFYLRERQVDIFKYIIISSTNPFIVNALDKESKKRGLDKLGLVIFPDYSDLGVPKEVWDTFMDNLGGYEKLFDLSTRWVSLEHIFITEDRIKKYYAKNTKIMGWGVSPDAPYFNELSAVLLSY